LELLLFFYINIAQPMGQSRSTKESILSEISRLEKERARLAPELQDELGPLLAAIRMSINWNSGLLAKKK